MNASHRLSPIDKNEKKEKRREKKKDAFPIFFVQSDRWNGSVARTIVRGIFPYIYSYISASRVSRFVSRIAIMREHDELAARYFVRNRCISRRASTTLTWVNKLLVFEFFSRSGEAREGVLRYCSKTGRHGTRRIVRIHMRNRQ